MRKHLHFFSFSFFVYYFLLLLLFVMMIKGKEDEVCDDDKEENHKNTKHVFLHIECWYNYFLLNTMECHKN